MSVPIINNPAPINRSIKRLLCPTCGRLRYMLVWMYEWYGPHVVCTKCGECWNDGEREPRPFQRNWRQKSVESAKWHWRYQNRKAERQP